MVGIPFFEKKEFQSFNASNVQVLQTPNFKFSKFQSFKTTKFTHVKHNKFKNSNNLSHESKFEILRFLRVVFFMIWDMFLEFVKYLGVSINKNNWFCEPWSRPPGRNP